MQRFDPEKLDVDQAAVEFLRIKIPDNRHYLGHFFPTPENDDLLAFLPILASQAFAWLGPLCPLHAAAAAPISPASAPFAAGKMGSCRCRSDQMWRRAELRKLSQ